MEDVIFYIRGEACPKYSPIDTASEVGTCGITKTTVNLNAGCRRPESCSVLESRDIQVKEL